MAGSALVSMALLIPVLTCGGLLVASSTTAVVIVRRHFDFGSKLARLIGEWEGFPAS